MRILAFALAAALALPAAADESLFEGLGGKAGIGRIVETFVPLIRQDPRIGESFRDTDIRNLTLRLKQQFCVLAGGPCKYGGKDMKTIHDGLNITNAQFNALAEDLQDAMDRNGVPSAVQNQLLAKLAPMQREIVTK